MDTWVIFLVFIVIPVCARIAFPKKEKHIENISDVDTQEDSIMGKKKKVIEVEEVDEKRHGGCLKPILIIFLIIIALAVLSPNKNNNAPSPAKPNQTATATPTHQPTNTPKPTRTPQPTKTPIPTATPTETPAIPGTYRPGIEGTNAYDVTVAMKEIGIEPPKRQNVKDGYSWMSETYKEGNVSYNIEIETTKDFRVTTMQIMMSGGNNNFVWWASACMFGENSEQVLWLKDNMCNESTTTKTFADNVWTLFPMPNGVMLTVEHIDAEKWYISQI